jgi:hypothetical protein
MFVLTGVVASVVPPNVQAVESSIYPSSSRTLQVLLTTCSSREPPSSSLPEAVTALSAFKGVAACRPASSTQPTSTETNTRPQWPPSPEEVFFDPGYFCRRLCTHDDASAFCVETRWFPVDLSVFWMNDCAWDWRRRKCLATAKQVNALSYLIGKDVNATSPLLRKKWSRGYGCSCCVRKTCWIHRLERTKVNPAVGGGEGLMMPHLLLISPCFVGCIVLLYCILISLITTFFCPIAVPVSVWA